MSFKGKFVWYELMTTDLKAAEKFYSGVVGWRGKDAGMPNMKYTLMSAGDAQVAGMMTVPMPNMHPSWVGYIAVDDVDAAAAAVAKDGGAVHKEPADIPGVGRFAVVSDPQGVGFALFRGTMDAPPAPPPPNTPGHAGWHELHAVDGAKAWDFYSKHFGWTKDQAMDMGPMGVYQLFSANGSMIGGMMTKTKDMPHPTWIYYFNVEAIDAAAARVKAGGGQVINGPMEVPGPMWIVQCVDPQGGLFALLGMKR